MTKRIALASLGISVAAWHGLAHAAEPQPRPGASTTERAAKPAKSKPSGAKTVAKGDTDPDVDPDEHETKIGLTGTLVRPEMRVTIDLGPSLLFRRTASGPAALYNSSPVVSGWLRGAVWWGRQLPNLTRPFRVGAWLGYRYQPGPVHEMLASSDSKGLRTWMLAHDLSAGVTAELAAPTAGSIAWFVRPAAGLGLTLTTLQLDSLDDGHVYSHTRPALNTVFTLETGVRFWHVLEVTVGFGGQRVKKDARLQLDLGPGLPTVGPTISDVSRSGWLGFAGLGTEF